MKISAIVSAYYAEEFLEQRLKNLEEQEVEGGMEAIVVCQKESPEFRITDAFAKEPASGEFRMKVVLSDDIPTVYAAWNLAIEQASGEYITNSNSDDLLYPGALQALSTALNTHKAYSISYFDWERVQKHGEAPIGVFRFAEGGLDRLMNEGCFLGPGPMWRRSLHEKYGLFDPSYRSAGDFEYWLRLAYNKEKFYHVRGAPLGAHLERDDGLEHRSPMLTTWETARVKAKYNKEYEHV